MAPVLLFPIRDASDTDSAGLIDLIRSVFSEYEGCVFEIEELPDLRSPATAFRQVDGRMWVAEGPHRLAGVLALTPHGDSIEIHRLYVRKEYRRNGIARRLMTTALEEAARRQARYVELWTDTRFVEGHRFYESLGFQKLPETRELGDLSQSVEYHYGLELGGKRHSDVVITRVDGAELRRRFSGFTSLLQDAVESGASIGFLPPLPDEKAATYWAEVEESLSTRNRVLLAVIWEDQVAGCVQLDLATKPNALHRAEVMKLMVHRRMRQRGIGRALMLAAEDAARSLSRTLLVLDTRRGDVSERLYEKLGYQRAGTIPEYARSASGELHDTVIFFKKVDA
jgi:ribosomal protein S18 acetylase RimI-like enzyme